MADALVSPAIGGAMWAVSAGLIGHCSHKLRQASDHNGAPLMGVMAAFTFAAQMINFAIPGTGSSGHLGGGLLLTLLLGPHGAFLTMASVLVVQALLFADGGLLALGCNIFNLGFFPCFVAYPIFFKWSLGARLTTKRLAARVVLASVVALQLGSFAIVLEVLFSGISDLPFGTFVLLMQPIHLAIGLLEGLATTLVVLFVWSARPDLRTAPAASHPNKPRSARRVLAGLGLASVIIAGLLSWFASSLPDGLEWAVQGTLGHRDLEEPPSEVHATATHLQETTALLPEYAISHPSSGEAEKPEPESWPAIDGQTSVAGLVGALVTLLIAGALGLAIKRGMSRPNRGQSQHDPPAI